MCAAAGSGSDRPMDAKMAARVAIHFMVVPDPDLTGGFDDRLGREDTVYAVQGKAKGQRYAAVTARNKSGPVRFPTCDVRTLPILCPFDKGGNFLKNATNRLQSF